MGPGHRTHPRGTRDHRLSRGRGGRCHRAGRRRAPVDGGRLVATMEDRVKTREQGALQGQYVGRVAELDAILDRARLEDFTISNENRPLDDVAKELLVRAGWLSP